MIQHALRCCGSDAGQEMQQAESRNAVAGIFDEPQQRQHVLDVAGSRNFSPPNLTNGIFRRVSSISIGPLWLDVRNSQPVP
jgi:hypothetical protein